MNKDQMNLVSKDKGVRYVSTNNSSTTFPYVSCYIVWYHLKDSTKKFEEIVEKVETKGTKDLEKKMQNINIE
jgi:hypothetical protein